MATVSVIPLTAVGVGRFVLLPSPICPLEFAPQQRMVPSTRNAHVCSPPAAMAAVSVIPLTAVGVGRFVLLPSPICPLEFAPQQRMVPSTRNAHV